MNLSMQDSESQLAQGDGIIEDYDIIRDDRGQAKCQVKVFNAHQRMSKNNLEIQRRKSKSLAR